MINLLILFVLIKRDLTMYAIRKHIKDKFAPFTNPSFGALKPALVKLEKEGFITCAKVMSDGGKLSVFYSVTDNGLKELRRLLLKPFSVNPVQFLSDARIKLSCLSFLSDSDAAELFEQIKAGAYLHRKNAQNLMNDEYTPVDFYQKIVLDNTVCEYNNFINMIEGLEKNARNS